MGVVMGPSMHFVRRQEANTLSEAGAGRFHDVDAGFHCPI